MSHRDRMMWVATAMALGAGLGMCGSAAAQAQKKVYCWNEGGQRVCSDALPPGKENLARDEISARSGLRTGQVQRALSEESAHWPLPRKYNARWTRRRLGDTQAHRSGDAGFLPDRGTAAARVRRAHQHRREQHPHLALQRGQPARGDWNQPAAPGRRSAAG